MNREQGQKELWILVATLLAIGDLGPTMAAAQSFVSGSTGAGGPLNPTCTPTPCTVNVDLPPNGVFNFTTVNIPAGVTVKFNRNALNTPVFILATGDVTISGVIDVSGMGVAPGSPVGASGGPGGFDGGNGAVIQSSRGADGLGPGGGGGSSLGVVGPGGGGFRSAGGNGEDTRPVIFNPVVNGGAAYGTEFLNPLIGGSGGGGGGSTSRLGGGGGGGGGATLMASSGAIILSPSGQVRAIGGNGGRGLSPSEQHAGCGGGGSGGGIRLIANTIVGNASGVTVSKGGGGVSFCSANGGAGSDGGIRVEFFNQSVTTPFPSIASLGRPGPVFVPGTPTLKITSVGGVAVPPTPSGLYLTPDLSLPPTTANPVTVDLAATNIPLGTLVSLSVIPQFGAKTSANSTPLAGSLANSTARAQVNLPVGTGTPVVLAAQATFATQQASLLPTVNGEKLASVKVGATMGEESTLAYVTESGQEIPASRVGPLFYTKLEGSGAKEASR